MSSHEETPPQASGAWTASESRMHSASEQIRPEMAGSSSHRRSARASGTSRSVPAAARATSTAAGHARLSSSMTALPSLASVAHGRVEQRTLVHALVPLTLVVRHAHLDGAGARAAPAVVGLEADVVHAAVSLAGALRAHVRRGGADAEGVRARVAVAGGVGGLVLEDGEDRGRDRMAVRIGDAGDRDADEP